MRCGQCGTPAPAGGKFCNQCGAALGPVTPIDPFHGQTIGGYRILSTVGEGGMAKVYRAEQTKLRREVCVKTLLPQFANDPNVVSRFELEGVATASMKHPNVVSVIDFGRTDDGLLYIVMEYVEGITLRHILRDQSPVSVERALSLVDQILGALDEAHANSVIHRDLKPSNVLVTRLRDGSDMVKVVDFGIAKVGNVNEPQKQLTKTGMMVGTPGYMSPEQMTGLEIEATSDLYSVGVILWELLTGVRLFRAENEFELMQHHISTRALPPSGVSPLPLPAGLDEVVLKALEKRPEKRHRSAQAFRRELDLIRFELRVGADSRVPLLQPESVTVEPPESNPLDGLRGLVPEKLLEGVTTLAQSLKPEETRTAVVGFLELGGQRGLSEVMKPAPLFEVLSGLVHQLGAQIERAGGRVERLPGWCMGFVFCGTLAGHEEAARAVSACRAMVEVVSATNERLGKPLSIRIGAHAISAAGPIGAGWADTAGLSEALAVARRVASSAQPMKTVVTSAVSALDTKARVSDVGLLAGNEGLGAMLQVEPDSRSTAIMPAPLFGRQTELAALSSIIERVASGRPGGAALVGAAGLGRSRLAQEAASLAETRGVTALVARGGRMLSSSPYDVLRQLLARFFVIDGLSASLAPVVQERIKRVLAGAVLEQQSDEEEALEKQALVEALLTFAMTVPLLIIIDDAHLADAASLAVLEDVATRAAKRRLGLLATARPGELSAPFSRLKVMELKPLTPEATSQLVFDRFRDGEPDTQVVEAVQLRAEGNPLLARELVRALVDGGGVSLSGGAWHLTGTPKLPGSLALVVGARLERLSKDAHDFLKVAALVGRTFSLELVMATLLHPGAPQALVTELLEAELLIQGGASGTYTFAQVVLHEAVVQRIARAEAQAIHQRVVAALERGTAPTADDPVLALARHAVEGALTQKAITYTRRAGDRLVARRAWAEAVVQYRQCLELVSDESGKKGPLSDAEVGTVLELTAAAMSAQTMVMPLDALALYDEVIPSLPSAGPPAARASVLRERGRALSRLLKPAEAEGVFQQALALASEDALVAGLSMDLAAAQESRGDLAGATNSMLEAMKRLANAKDDRNLLWTCLNGLGRLHVRAGKQAEAKAYFESARLKAQSVESALGESKAVTNLAVLAAYRKDTSQALALFLEAQALALQAGDRVGVLRARFNRARVLQDTGKTAEATAELKAVLEGAREAGWREGEALASRALSGPKA